MITLQIKDLGRTDYLATLNLMQRYTQERTEKSADQIWITEHNPVFTQGQAGDPQYLGELGDIPLVQTDRGGQVTYHGPGQLVFYTLIDLSRKKVGVKELVHQLEASTLACLHEAGIPANRMEGAPGLYVADHKIAALGLKVKRGCSYHGLSLNLHMNLEPYQRITACGLQGIGVTQWQQHAPLPSEQVLIQRWVNHFANNLCYAETAFI